MERKGKYLQKLIIFHEKERVLLKKNVINRELLKNVFSLPGHYHKKDLFRLSHRGKEIKNCMKRPCPAVL
jgi:hypothetical protein